MNDKNRKEVALNYSSKGFNCAQAVLVAFADDFNVDEQTALRITGAMGGGIRCGEMCSAILGGACAIGLKYGQASEEDSESKVICNKNTKKLTSQFKEIHNEVTCTNLLGYNLNDLSKEEFEKIKDDKKKKFSKFIIVCV